MRKLNLITKKSMAVLLVLIMVCGMIPKEVVSDLLEVLSPLLTAAAEAVGNIGSGKEYNAPECSFMDELYDGADAIKPLPSYQEYKEQTGYTEPLRMSLTDFRAECGEGLLFDRGTAAAYMSDGYKLMICNAEELYNYSQIVNGAGSPDEISFYLSANIVLGDNIEYSEMSYEEFYLLPIGNDTNPFTGTFDGQCFEIRDAYLDKNYNPATVAFFGVVGEGAEVRNFGLFHPTINSTKNNSTFTAGIASRNYGTIDSVYVIAQEYRNPDVVAEQNVISSANAQCAGGLVAENYSSGSISNSYFAGMLDAADPVNQNPVCAVNSGSVVNCYYDKDVFASGISGSNISEIDGEVTGLSNIDLKKVNFSENGMQNTSFKPNLATYVTNSNYFSADVHQQCWTYPRLYGFTGVGTQDDPYIISTPADLIYFPTSGEYIGFGKVYRYFRLEKCIDMNEVAPNAYKPKLDFKFYTNIKSGGNWVQRINIYNFQYFYGELSGAALNGDDDCSVCHIADRGTDANGNPLQECHSILNLTINTPATSATKPDYHCSSLIAYASSVDNATYFSAVRDLNFIGGEISSGDMDCMPSTYNSSAYNVRTATVIAYSYYADMSNVHSSATVKVGTGRQYSVVLGGLMATGNFHNVTDCTNSGNVIGGYVNMPGDSFVSENYILGGLLGYSTARSDGTVDQRYLGKLTHVANYGNVYGVVVVADEGSGWTITSGSICIDGITHNYCGSIGTGNTVNNPSGQSSYFFDDNSRCDRIANFGMLFDGPIVLDEYGKPVFDEEGKPQALPLYEGKEIVGNNSPLHHTYINAIGASTISHAYNEGNLYSVTIEKCHIRGIGAMGNAYNSTIDQYYNFLNYNKGNIYMYVGASEAHGIADQYAYKCYNSGNIYLLDGAVNSDSAYKSNSSNGGLFSGISGIDSRGCYNDGDIYLAPAARSNYGTGDSYQKTISVAGVSQRYSSYIRETDENGTEVIIPTINAGTVTVDLDKNNFDPLKNTPSSATNIDYYPRFYMMGTGMGVYNENYGEFLFTPNTQDKSNKVSLEISPCGGLFKDQWAANISNCRNYVDISVDTSAAEGGLRNLTVYGIGRNSSNGKSIYSVTDSVNLGDISFMGYLGGGFTVYSISAESHVMNNCAYLGNITIDESSVIGGSVQIYGAYAANNKWSAERPVRIDSLMFGWYDGCKLPPGLDNDEFKAILSTLDKSKHYGQINISGTVKGAVYIRPVSFYSNSTSLVNYAKNVINNGSFTVTDANITGSFYLHGLSDCPISYSENYAPINAENVLLHDNSGFRGAAPGEYNVNYAPINVTHCLTLTTKGECYTYVTGVYNGLSVSHCENRGDITVKECTTATVSGTLYQSPVLTGASGTTGTYDSIFSVSGVGTIVSNSVNFGDINVSEVNRCYIGGIGHGVNTSINDSYNYGNITCTNSGGQLRIGGIAGNSYGEYYSLKSCYNFGKISVVDPNSYWVYNTSHYPSIYVGGICGYTNKNFSLSSSVNYGEISYNNTKGENTAQKYDNTRLSTNFRLYIGGVVGYGNTSTTVTSSMNYADVNVLNECNMYVCAGGISGAAAFNGTTKLSSNLVNYGNVNVPNADADMKQLVYCGSIIGGCFGSGTNQYKYGINYGTVKSATEKASNTYIGSLVGRTNDSGMKYSVNNFVDLSEPPQGYSYYPLLGGVSGNSVNADGNINYTKNEASIDDTTAASGGRFGSVKLVTLDKQEQGGVFSADFVFRSAILHEITGSTNLDNMMMYQDFNLLSPYLQNYMVERFGDEIKKYGAYVVMKYGRQTDGFIPGEMVTWDESNEQAVKEQLPGLYGTFFDESLVDDDDINPVYSSMVSPSSRSMYTDYNIYAQQVDKSSLAEIYDIGVKTKYLYANTDTSFYQSFSEYQNIIQTHPAYDKNNNVSDTVTYTDINLYIAIDDIDPYKAKRPLKDESGNVVHDENGDVVYEIFDTNGNIYITQSFDNLKKYGFNYSEKSTVQYYQGSTVDLTKRLSEMDKYTDQYPDSWLTCDNLADSLSVDDDWGIEHHWRDKEVPQEEKTWEMAIPFKTLSDTQNVYSKVLGVVTAEDGVHKNIVVAHVIIDYYKPHATINGVTLYTPSDGTLTSTVENGKLISEEGQPSKTDAIDDVPVNDVTYYYLSDENLKGENIQRYSYDSSTNPTTPRITVDTYNMDSTGKIYYQLRRQDRIPGDGEKYNDLRWNPLGNDDILVEGTVTPTNIEYNDQQQSTGTATVSIGTHVFYGGYYRLDLYYERTKDSDTKKHFATVFIAKQYSEHNTIGSQYVSDSLRRTPYSTLADQQTYDSTHPLIDGMQTGYFARARNSYNYTSLWNYYYARESNDCRPGNPNNNTNYSSGNGLYYGLKGYMVKHPVGDIYLDVDNPIYNPENPEEEQENEDTPPRGKKVTLYNCFKSAYVFRDDTTGAFYPTCFQGVMDIMAENGDIRRYIKEEVQTGAYGENDEYTRNNPPKIYQTSAKKDGYPIIADSDSTYTGIVYGDEKSDITFTCQWSSTNVSLYHKNNRPVSGEAYAGDGYSAEKIRIYYTPINSGTTTELTAEQIAECFSTITCNTSNNWTFNFKNSAPVGNYSIIPYMDYHMDLSSNPDMIKLYDSETNEFISESEDNILKWTIPYSQPFVIENRPNDDSYLTEYNTSNDQYTPFVSENSYIEGGENRNVYIRSASVNQEIVYVGYEDVRVGDTRVDKFNIYSYVAKTSQTSDLRMKAPYMATVKKWEGTSSPFETLSGGDWKEVTPSAEEDGFREYNFQIEYNEKISDEEYSYKPSITYYKVTAEDETTATVYAVYVVPGVRNKETSLEIAQSAETVKFGGSEQFRESMTEKFNESDEIYNEILQNNGAVTATIKELNGNIIDVYQTKIFDDVYQQDGTQPYIYNLKSFAFDISVDLPAGYDYDVMLFSSAMDSCSTLKNSQNGFDGKQLILSSSDAQSLHIRIVLKRASSSDLWGVQHIWNYYNANANQNGEILNDGGGYFYNYVYKREN